ncbi:MAG: hypothetical protein V1724_02035, partial [Chloroflexota bacterium]
MKETLMPLACKGPPSRGEKASPGSLALLGLMILSCAGEWTLEPGGTKDPQAVPQGPNAVPQPQTLTIGDYRRSYLDFARNYDSLRALQVVSDKVVLQEYVHLDQEKEKVFAGHLGGFYAAPYFSAARDPKDVRDGFNVSLALADGDQTRWQEHSALEEGHWYPSKLVVSKSYPSATVGTHTLRVSKFGLPDRRAFAMKVQVDDDHLQNRSSVPGMGILFWVNIPAIGKLPSGVWFKGGCKGICKNTGGTRCGGGRHDAFYYFDSTAQICFPFRVIGDGRGTFTSHVTDHTPAGYQALHDDFRKDGAPELDNSCNDDPDRDGSKVGIFFRPHPEAALSSYKLAFLAAVGPAGSEAECQAKLEEWLGGYEVSTIESLADASADEKLARLYRHFPKFHSARHVDLEQVYRNGFLHLPLGTFKKDGHVPGAAHNGYEPLDPAVATYVQMAPFFGQCSGMFAWDSFFFASSWALADPVGLREQIIKFLALDWKTQRSYDNLYGKHSPGSYSFHYWAMAKIVYDYVTASDLAFLDEVHPGAYGTMSMLEYLQQMADEPESTRRRWDGKVDGPNTQLLDFGHDANTYEFGIHCDHQGKLNGFLFSPNVERYEQSMMLADIYRVRKQQVL